MSAAVPLILILGAMACVVLGIVVAIVAVARKRPQETTPSCGHCGYNLTGAPANRCPECGQLFIEAGVVTRTNPARMSRGTKRIVWMLVIGLTLLSGLGASFMVMRNRALRSQAIAMQQAALAAQQRALANERQADASAATELNTPTDAPRDAP